MRKKMGFKFASITVGYPDGKKLAPKLRKLLWDYCDAIKPYYDRGEGIVLSAFLLYCSYVSRNHYDLTLDDLFYDFEIDGVRDCLGNDYLAAEFIDYYAGLHEQDPSLLDLRGTTFAIQDLSKAIFQWVSLLDESGLSLMEWPDDRVANTLKDVLVEVLMAGPLGKETAEHTSSPSVARLVARLADVNEKSVLDFVCGNGLFLSAALDNGAKEVKGADVNYQSVALTKILCFFSGPHCGRDIITVDALSAASATLSAQRVLAAPPLGVRLREHDISERGYVSDVFGCLSDEAGAKSFFFEDYCIAKALACLTEGGIAVLHVSASLLFHQQKGRQALRRALVEGGLLRAVIELPGGCVPGTTVKSALLVIGKETTDDGVFIVDLDCKDLPGAGYLEKGRGRCDITDKGIDWVAGLVARREEVSLVSTVVERGDMLATGYNLCYSAYGDVYDISSALSETRSSEEIMGDIKAAQEAIERLDGRIDDILRSIG